VLKIISFLGIINELKTGLVVRLVSKIRAIVRVNIPYLKDYADLRYNVFITL